jgi:hypothetical protein
MRALLWVLVVYGAARVLGAVVLLGTHHAHMRMTRGAGFRMVYAVIVGAWAAGLLCRGG